ncbi:MAG: hypothetical protein Q9220_003765 [cf. Caloplaca sp. 1 TL-2023]
MDIYYMDGLTFGEWCRQHPRWFDKDDSSSFGDVTSLLESDHFSDFSGQSEYVDCEEHLSPLSDDGPTAEDSEEHLHQGSVESPNSTTSDDDDSDFDNEPHSSPPSRLFTPITPAEIEYSAEWLRVQARAFIDHESRSEQDVGKNLHRSFRV